MDHRPLVPLLPALALSLACCVDFELDTSYQEIDCAPLDESSIAAMGSDAYNELVNERLAAYLHPHSCQPFSDADGDYQLTRWLMIENAGYLFANVARDTPEGARAIIGLGLELSLSGFRQHFGGGVESVKDHGLSGADGFHRMLNDSQWPGSNNQAGHFMVAVDLGAVVGAAERDGQDPIGGVKQEIFALVLGHERVGDDQGIPAQVLEQWPAQIPILGQFTSDYEAMLALMQIGMYDQVHRTPGRIPSFEATWHIDAISRVLLPNMYDREIQEELALGDSRHAACRVEGRQHAYGAGNSLEDMRLSVMGLAFGALAAWGDFDNPEQAGLWLDNAISASASWPSCVGPDLPPYPITPVWPESVDA